MATLCDFCLADDELAPQSTESMSVAINGVAYDLDACERHRKPLVELAAWLAEHVRPLVELVKPHVPPPAPARAPSTASAGTSATAPAKRVTRPASANRCPQCGGKPYASRQSLASHARQTHGMTLGELEGRPSPFACPQCNRPFTTNAGLSLHVKAKHAEPA